MTSPELATTYDWGRLYARSKGGEPTAPSITTVLDVLNPDMGWWEALCAVNACMDNAGRLYQVSQGSDWREKRKATDWLRDAAKRDRDAAAARGDFVHNYAEAYALREMGAATDADVERHRLLCEENGVLAYLEHFHAFWQDYKPRPVQAEATVWNETVGYAGTTDLLCEITTNNGPKRVVLDWKTEKGIYNKRTGERKSTLLQPYTGMQLCAAAMAEEVWEEGPGDAGHWVPFEFEPEVGLAVGIGPDGYVVSQYDIYNPLMWETFKALRRAFDFKRGGGASMQTPPLEGVEHIIAGTPRSTLVV